MGKYVFRLLILVFIGGVVGCSDANNTRQATNLSTIDSATSVETAKVDSSALKFDLLEALFNNENWLFVKGGDTSFLYCSRLGKTYCKTYYYRMHNGDSTATVASEIMLSGTNIVWPAPPVGSMLRLAAITATAAKWNDSNNDMYSFQKLDNNNILLTGMDTAPLPLKRTITLSSFLVKSKYDYQHGTRLAYENPK